jgi:hypothetical protein
LHCKRSDAAGCAVNQYPLRSLYPPLPSVVAISKDDGGEIGA